MCSAVVLVEGAGAEISWFDGLADNVGFADPGALGVWEDDGDDVAVALERLHEGVDIGGGLLGGGTVVVYYLWEVSIGNRDEEAEWNVEE